MKRFSFSEAVSLAKQNVALETSQRVSACKEKNTDRTNHTTPEEAIANNVARGLLSESMMVQNEAKKSYRPIY